MQRATRLRKKKIKQVQSGIALSNLDVRTGKQSAEAESFLTSRTARVLLAGAGFLADAYDLFVINLVLRLLREEYPQYTTAGSIHYLEGSVASAALVGSMLGQIVAGALADQLGRKIIFIATAALIIIGSLGSACAIDTPMLTIYGQVCCWRFFLGAGVGGEYPLAATVTSESSSAGRRGSLMSAVFAMQGVGSLLSGLVVLACLSAGLSLAFTWRFALAFGALPPALAFPYRMRMHETEAFKRLVTERRAREVHRQLKEGGVENKLFYGGDSISHDNTNNNNNSHNHSKASNNRGNGYGAVEMTGARGAGKGPSEQAPLLREGHFVRMPDGGVFYHEIGDTSESPSPSLNATPDGSPPPRYAENTRHPAPRDAPYTDIVPPTPASPPHRAAAAAASGGHWGEIRRAFVYYKWHLLGTALSWFLLDVDFYANGLFNHEVTSVILGEGNGGVFSSALLSLLLSLIALPGYLLSVLYLDRVGRKNVQLLGFTAMGVLFLICCTCYDILIPSPEASESKVIPFGPYLFLSLYALTFLFSNFGPNTTSFVIPGEIYPAEVRATCHGLSAAAGKLGAAGGAYFFPMLLGPDESLHPTPRGMKNAFLACSLVAFIGVLVTFFLTPQYDSDKLETGAYLELDFSCLRPSAADMDMYGAVGEDDEDEREGMLQVVQSAHDYALDGVEEGGKL